MRRGRPPAASWAVLPTKSTSGGLTVDALCPKVYELADSWELAGEMLARLHQAAADNGWDTIVCCAPEEPGRIEHLLIPGLGLAFVTSRPGMEYGQKPFRRVRLDAMKGGPQGKARLRFQTRMAALLQEGAAALGTPKPTTISWRQSTTPMWISTVSEPWRRWRRGGFSAGWVESDQDAGSGGIPPGPCLMRTDVLQCWKRKQGQDSPGGKDHDQGRSTENLLRLRRLPGRPGGGHRRAALWAGCAAIMPTGAGSPSATKSRPCCCRGSPWWSRLWCP